MPDVFSLQDKCAFISGGGSGIGLGVARRFIEAGARVAISDIADCTTVAKELGALFVRADVSNEADVVESLGVVSRKMGTLDIVVNNAGLGDIGPTFQNTDDALIDKLLSVNLKGVLYGLKHAPSHMNDHGSIINTASLAAFVSMPGMGVYAASKAAVVSMTRTAALELAERGIRVNALCPSQVDTPMAADKESRLLSTACTALGRQGSVGDLVGVYHFLAAAESRYITGQALPVDGGWRAGLGPGLLARLLGDDRQVTEPSG